MKLSMNPQSARGLAPMVKDGIVQISNISGVPIGVQSIKIRWKVSYRVRGQFIEEMGENNSVYVG
jgi:hypothetical protein